MTKQHEPKASKFDLMEYLRKPHGIAIVAIALAVAGWAIWTFVVW